MTSLCENSEKRLTLATRAREDDLISRKRGEGADKTAKTRETRVSSVSEGNAFRKYARIFEQPTPTHPFTNRTSSCKKTDAAGAIADQRYGRPLIGL
jgi:hypothetical protein